MNHPGAAGTRVPHSTDATPRALLADLEPALGALFAEWLEDAGIDTVHLRGEPVLASGRPVGLIVAGIAFPRHGPPPRLQQLAGAFAGTPVLAISPTFLAGVGTRGEIARRLGVAAVLPATVGREGLLGEVQRLLATAA